MALRAATGAAACAGQRAPIGAHAPRASVRRFFAAALIVAASTGATAAEFRSVADPAIVLYDAPSVKAKPLYILGHGTPLEVIVPVEGWVKVKDVDGTFGWVEKKGLAERRMLIVRPPAAEVRASADEKAALVFRAEPGVLLELAEPVTSAASAAVPGWVKAKHPDGQSGFVRITQVFGL